jgi:opacity protein-like surface antigen
MKSFFRLLILLIFMTSTPLFSQEYVDTKKSEHKVLYVVTKNDGSQYVGYIISQDAREVLIETKSIGQLIIPKHEIRQIKELGDNDKLAGDEVILEDEFISRYFYSSNGFPLKKGEGYVLWSLWGPNLQYGATDRLGLGLATSWIGVPIAFTGKYTFPIGENINGAVGAVFATGSWAALDFGLFLPYTSITFGEPLNNVTLSAGYTGVAYLSEDFLDGSFVCSIAGRTSITPKLALVLDSYIVPSVDLGGGDRTVFAAIIPGIRIKTGDAKAFQFGFAGVYFDGEVAPLPIPMLKWFRKL